MTSEPAATEASPVVERRAPRRLVAIGVVVAIAATAALGAYLARDPFADLPDDPSVTVNLAGVLPAEGEEPLIKPAGVAMSGNRVYVADAGAGTVRIFDRYGRDKGRIVLPGTNGAIAGPIAIAIDDADRLAVVDSVSGRVLVLSAAASESPEVLFALGGEVPDAAPARAVSVAFVRREFYVADTADSSVKVYDEDGALVRQLGYVAGESSEEHPGGVMATADSVFVSDTSSGRVVELDSETGDFVGEWPDTYTLPRGLTAVGDGFALADVLGQAVYVCDQAGARTHTINAEAVPEAEFGLLEGVAWDPAKSRLYVTDSVTHRVGVFNVRLP